MSKAVARIDRKRAPWEKHRDSIADAWQQSITAFIETGRLLIEAKEELEHGQFESMLQVSLPFDPSTARRLMKIASNPIIGNHAQGHVLPPSWRTLYEMTLLPPDVLRAKIEDGTIHPKIERRDVIAMRNGAVPDRGSRQPAGVIDGMIKSLERWKVGKTREEIVKAATHLAYALVGCTPNDFHQIMNCQAAEAEADGRSIPLMKM